MTFQLLQPEKLESRNKWLMLILSRKQIFGGELKAWGW